MKVILHERFQAKLAKAMELTGMSQTSLGKAMGKSPQYVHNYLVGHCSKPALDIVEHFATALGLPPEALIDATPIEEHLQLTVG